MKSVPFYENHDSLHCFEATFRSALAYFLPDRTFSWADLDRLTGKQPGLATWPQQMLINLHDMDFDIIMVEGFNGEAFIKQGGQYLIDTFGKEAAAWQIKHSDIPTEQKLYQEALDKGLRIEHRIPDLSEIEQRLREGYLVQCIVNSRRLNGQKGYVGHSVLVYDITDGIITMHDPGPPKYERRTISIADFEAAWADPDDNAKNYIAIKYKG